VPPVSLQPGTPERQPLSTGGKRVGMDEGRDQAHVAVGGIGPATALEGDAAGAVLTAAPRAPPASLAGEIATLDHSRTRRLHLRKIQAVTLI